MTAGPCLVLQQPSQDSRQLWCSYKQMEMLCCFHGNSFGEDAPERSGKDTKRLVG